MIRYFLMGVMLILIAAIAAPLIMAGWRALKKEATKKN